MSGIDLDRSVWVRSRSRVSLDVLYEVFCWAGGVGTELDSLQSMQLSEIRQPLQRGRREGCANLTRMHSSFWRTMCDTFLEDVPIDILKEMVMATVNIAEDSQ